MIKFWWWVFRAFLQDWYILVIWVHSSHCWCLCNEAKPWRISLLLKLFQLWGRQRFIYTEEVAQALGRNFLQEILLVNFWCLQLYRINSSVCLFGISEDFRFSTYFKCASTLSNSSIFLHYFIHISHLVTCSRFFHIYRRPSTFVNINPSQFCTFFVINLYHFALYGHSLIRKFKMSLLFSTFERITRCKLRTFIDYHPPPPRLVRFSWFALSKLAEWPPPWLLWLQQSALWLLVRSFRLCKNTRYPFSTFTMRL